MQRQRSVQPHNTLPAVKQFIRALKTAVEWHRRDTPARVTEVKPVFARAVESNHLVEDGRAHVQESSHLGLGSGQHDRTVS